MIGYGGAAGGGKSQLLLGKAFGGHFRKVGIFRREFEQVRDLIESSREIAPDAAAFNEALAMWRGKDGRIIRFAGLKEAEQWRKWKGRAQDLIGIDEATEFLEAQVRALIGWNRTTDPSIRPQTILTFNPPTSSEGEWVNRFFAPWLDPHHPNPAEPGEHRFFAMVDGEEREVDGPAPFEHVNEAGQSETITPTSRTFFPARVQDNPALIASGYVATLQGLPEPLRSQLLYGDFTIGLEDDAWQVIPTRWVLLAQERWRRGTPPAGGLEQLGVDVAAGGRDKTVLAPRSGLWLEPLVYLKPPAPESGEEYDGLYVARHIARVLDAYESPDALVVIDAIGVGAGPIAALATGMFGPVRVYRASMSEKSLATDTAGKTRFLNNRSAWWWRMREILDPDKGWLVALPPDAALRADLCAPRYGVRPGNVIQVEGRDEIIKRLGRSPDAGTACILAFTEIYVPDRTRKRALVIRTGRTGRRQAQNGRRIAR